MTSSKQLIHPVAKAPRGHLSEAFDALAARPEEDLSVCEIIAFFGPRAMGVAILFFAAPNIFPLPPGTSTVLGAPLFFITLQLILGRQTVWLPDFIGKRRITLKHLRYFVEKIDPWLLRAEKVIRPRLPFFTDPLGERFIGVACFLLTLVLLLPIPLGNLPPAIAMSFFALGMVERDGLSTLLGWVSTVISFVILAFVGQVAWLAAMKVFS
jgi:hypothetical protein